jgi:hypothetical protein
MYIFCINLCTKVVQDVCPFNLSCRYVQVRKYVGHGNLQWRWELRKKCLSREGVGVRIENKDTEIVTYLPAIVTCHSTRVNPLRPSGNYMNHLI